MTDAGKTKIARRARLAPFLVVAVALLVIGILRADRNSESTITLSVGGHERTALVHVPPSLTTNTPVALVLAFHGQGATADTMNGLTHFDDCADRNGFIVTYPQGIGRHWNDGRHDTSFIDDVAFTSALIDNLSSRYHIDPKRIYATGMSNGAMMCERLGDQLSNRIAAIAPVAGSLPVRLADAGLHGPSVSVIEFHGAADPLVPFAGGNVVNNKAGAVISAPDTAKAWAALDGCGAPTTSHVADGVGFDHTSVDLTDYGDGSTGAAVRLYVVNGAGHIWPGGPQYLPPFMIGHTTHAINATDLIWAFFAAHPKP